MIKSFIPLWIYWGALIAGCVIFCMCPLLLFLFLPLLVVIIPVWLIIVYLIGYAVQGKRGPERLGRRMARAFLCSFVTIAIFPVGLWLYEAVVWHALHFRSLINSFDDRLLWLGFALHFFAFWAGEEMGRLAKKA